jgi:hypothetical protein
MKHSLLTGAAMLMALSGAAYAEVTPAPSSGASTTGTSTTGASTTGASTTGASTTGASTTGASTTGASTSGQAAKMSAQAADASPGVNRTSASGTSVHGIRQQLMTSLEQAGFTDVKVMPDSFLVQAKDASGNPVTMFINPDSMSVFMSDASGTAGDKSAAAGHSASDVQTPSSATAGAPAGIFAQIPANYDLSSKLVGLDIYNSANQDIGTIKDIVFDGSRVKAYIVGVGGFLGMGDHYVAVRPSAITVTFDGNARKLHATMDTNADQLKAAPEYKYSSNY